MGYTGNTMTDDNKAFQARLKRVDALVQGLQATANPALRASTEELIQTLLELHGAGLARMLELIWDEGEAGERIIQQRLPEDELVSSLLLLHDLHPFHLEDRVQQGLNKVRPYLRSHGGEVEVLSIDDGVVRLRLRGNCESCPASAMTLKFAVEDAIYAAAPDVVEIIAVDSSKPPTIAGMIGLDQIAIHSGNGAAEQTDWRVVDNLNSLPQRTLRIQQVGDQSILFCRLGENLYAYMNQCPSCMESLDEARVESTTLVCTNCQQTYDIIRAGRGLDKPNQHLEPIPLLVEAGTVKLALPILQH
jgi:Fe-S cluster biogenesis protein NfuA/nitrite reductase/ring-hydroxylating ferredoxin subunit